MVHEEKKVAKIIEELTMFFFTVGSDEIETHIKRDNHSAHTLCLWCVRCPELHPK